MAGLDANACFGSLAEALERVEADVVVISTPPTLHGSQVALALSAGRHVFVEKPFTCDLAEAEALVAQAERAGLRMVVGQNDRYNPFNQALRAAVRDGRYGELGYCVLTHFKARGTPYHLSPHMHLWQQGVHQLDTLLAIVGRPVEEVFGTSVNPPWCDWPSESTVFAQVVFSGGVIGEYVGTSNARGNGLTFRAEFREAALVYDASSRTLVEEKGRERQVLTVEPASMPAEARLAKQLYDCVVSGEEPETSGRNNLAVLRVIDAIVRATEQRQAIRLSGAAHTSADVRPA